MPAENLAVTPESLADELLSALRARADAENVAGMQRFGISPVGTLGVTMTEVRGLARDARKRLGRTDREGRHRLAAALWSSGVHEARLMATVLDAPELVTREQVESWVLDIDSWDTCDQLCGNLLWRVAFAWDLPRDWTVRPETYVKRAGLVVATQLAKDRGADDDRFVPLLDLAAAAAFDERNDVKKGASWALRGIGKRSTVLNGAAIETSERLLAAALDVTPATESSKAARWVARDALRELRSDAVRARLGIA